MDKELVSKNKQRLLEEKSRLEKLLGRIAKPNPEVPGDYEARYEDLGDKPDENASEVAQYEVSIAEEQDLEVKLQKVNSALQRIEDGTYGKCLECGEEIPPERLEAIPEADTCIQHAK